MQVFMHCEVVKRKETDFDKRRRREEERERETKRDGK